MKQNAALFRELSELESKAMFEFLESSFIFNRWFRQEAQKLHTYGRKLPLRFWLVWKNR